MMMGCSGAGGGDDSLLLDLGVGSGVDGGSGGCDGVL